MPPVLVFNAGSSSLKYAAFDGPTAVQRGTVERIPPGGHADAVNAALADLGHLAPAAVGHRVVHGGERFDAPVVVTPEVLDELDRLTALAPLHQPAALRIIRAVETVRPGVPQVACFDTAFHRTLPPEEYTLPLPKAVRDRGVRRYGFHGLSYQSVAGRLPELSPEAAAGRTVACHLGSGASVCGLRAGVSVTTSMGFTPLDGLVMGTRPGRLDPGVLLHLLRTGQTVDELEEMLEHRCGLRGLSDASNDIRDLLSRDDSAARLAIEIFCRSVAKEIAAAAVALGGLDAIVFTGGIGENSPPIRARVCGLLGWLGIALDESANAANAERLSVGRVRVLRVPTDEEAVIAAAAAGERPA